MPHIRFAAEILRRLGEELNPSPDQGIIELVKNAHDADARTCQVELINTDHPGGSVRVTDDGSGMDLDGIVNGWLVLGKSQKSTQIRTPLGRVPAGSKGLGRLAALRMGAVAELKTRPASETRLQIEYNLTIDWDMYNGVEVVEDVELDVKKARKKSKYKPGTEILLTGLRTRLGRMDVKRLARALILLADPFDDNPDGFKPALVASEYEDLEKLVQRRYFDDADYHMFATVNEDGKATATLTDWKGKELFSASHSEIANESKPKNRGRMGDGQTNSGGEPHGYGCPPCKFDFWTFLLKKADFSARTATVSEVRSWLNALGGVHLYENGLRVAPYGDPGNDWLDINLRRSQLSEERPSTNNSIGRIIIPDSGGVMLQKTDRSGFIEGDAFSELKRFAKDALEWMGKRRLEIAVARRGKERSTQRSTRAKRQLHEVISKVPTKAQDDLLLAFQTYERAREREARALRREIQLYRTLSTAGITTATFAHESAGSPVKVIGVQIRTIERRSRTRFGADYEMQMQKPVDSIGKAVASLEVLSTTTLKLLDHGKRRVEHVAIHDVIGDVLDLFAPYLDSRKVRVQRRLCGGSPYLRGSQAAIESIITNLINNCLTAFEHSENTSRTVVVETRVLRNDLTLRVLDNGPGIRDISLRDIWLPGQTTRSNGTGLGLTIVRDSVRDLGGDVDAVAQGELGGAEIIVRFPILGT